MRIENRPGVAVLLGIAVFTAVLLRVAPALAQEKAPPLRRVAIMPLVNLKPDKETDWLGPGTAETLTTNLMKVSGLILVEQTQLAAVIYQQDRQIADFAAPKTAVKVGKIVGAERVLVGSYAKEGQAVLFNVRMVDVETGIILQAASVQGDWSKIFDLMTQLANAVIDSFDKKAAIVVNRPVAVDAPTAERIVLTEEQAKRLKDWGTSNREAFEAFSRGRSAKDPNDKLPWYTKAIELDLKYSFAYNNRGNVYANMGDQDRAIKDYDRAIELDPSNVAAYVSRGIAYANMGDQDRAIKDYDKAIELDPSNVAAYVSRGIAYANMGDQDRAIKDYDKAIELDPSNVAAYVSRGIAYAKKGDQDRAIKDYDKAIELDLKYSFAYVNRGIAYAKKGDRDRAIKDYDKAIELDPGLAMAFNNRAYAYVGKGDYEKALKDAEHAVTLLPNNPSIYETRAESFCGVGQYDRAWDDVRTCLRLGGKIPPEFLDRLRKASGRNE